jgi:hypothetical protein
MICCRHTKVLSELKPNGSWEIPWERLTVFKELYAIALNHDDARESLSSVLSSGLGSYRHSKVVIKKIPKRYGSNGNSFVCAVEFEQNQSKIITMEVLAAILPQNIS